MKQAAGEKASVAGSRSPPGSLCEDRVRDSAEDTTLGHRDNTAPPNSERANGLCPGRSPDTSLL